jgi:hypothetical protein
LDGGCVLAGVEKRLKRGWEALVGEIGESVRYLQDGYGWGVEASELTSERERRAFNKNLMIGGQAHHELMTDRMNDGGLVCKMCWMCFSFDESSESIISVMFIVSRSFYYFRLFYNMFKPHLFLSSLTVS